MAFTNFGTGISSLNCFTGYQPNEVFGKLIKTFYRSALVGANDLISS